MKTQISLTGMPSSPALKEYTSKHLNSLKRRLSNGRKAYEDARLQVRIRATAHKPTGLAKAFEAEILISIPHRSWIVIRKKSPDVHIAVSSAIEAAETAMRRDTEKREQGRRTVGRSHRSVRKLKRQTGL
jgi:ribosome-associated translation inhibitor RaiA